MKTVDYDQIKEPISYYPLPESLQPLSRHYCLYVPELIFGVIGSPTLTKHIILYKKRPYNAHLPITSSNLCNVHNTENNLLQIWFHDYYHSSSSWCRLVYKDFTTKKDIGEDVTEDNIEAMLSDPTSRLSQLFELEKENEKRKKGSFFTSVNDAAMLWVRRPPSFEGKMKRKQTKRIRKRRKSLLKSFHKIGHMF